MEALAGIGVKPGVSNLDILPLEAKLFRAPALENREALGILETLEGVAMLIECRARALPAAGVSVAIAKLGVRMLRSCSGLTACVLSVSTSNAAA